MGMEGIRIATKMLDGSCEVRCWRSFERIDIVHGSLWLVDRPPSFYSVRSEDRPTFARYLQDLVNHIVEFSGDQLGSRHIQQKLDSASTEEKQLVFTEILPNLLQLSTDVFANCTFIPPLLTLCIIAWSLGIIVDWKLSLVGPQM